MGSGVLRRVLGAVVIAWVGTTLFALHAWVLATLLGRWPLPPLPASPPELSAPAEISVPSTPKAPDTSRIVSMPLCRDVRVSAVTESSDPAWSSAVIQGPDDERGRTRRVGSVVGRRSILHIGSRSGEPLVWLTDGLGICQATLRAARAPTENRAVQAPVTEPRERLSFIPISENGKAKGIQFFGVPRDSLFGLLGLQRGDILTSVNGLSMVDPNEALRAYVLLRKASLLRVQLIRKGRPLEIRIHLI